MRSIVVIDDDRELRDTLRAVLEDEGYEVHAAENGAEGLACVRALVDKGAPPSLVLLDLMMPEMDGWAVSKAMHVDPRLVGVPVLVLSASSDTARRELGARPVLKKPIELDHLLRAVAKHAA